MQDQSNAYNNADSFAMIFDEAWQKHNFNKENVLSTEQKIDKILQENKEHPFIKNSPAQAKSVAKFRLRLLQLE